MKAGMKVIEKQQVGVRGASPKESRWVWLCEESLPGQGCREWATYVSTSPDAAETEHGHYFVNYSNAVQDYQIRLNSI